MSESEKFLSKKYYRRILLASGLSTAIALIAIRFFVIPYFTKQPVQDFTSIINAIIDNLFAALVSSLAVTLLILWLLPTSSKSNVNVVEPYELKSVLQESLVETSYFRYSGHTARWTCAVTLPYIVSEARARDTTIQVHITILDPDDKRACGRYALLRNRIGVEEQEPEYLRKKHRLELFAVIVSAYSWRAEEPRLDLEIGLSDKVSIFRVDLSSKAAIVTTPGVRKPALKFDSGSSFYNLFREDIISLHEQARILPKLPGIPFQQLNLNNTKKILQGLGLDLSDLIDEDIDNIANMARKAENPYPN
jgi:hypothetical protein